MEKTSVKAAFVAVMLAFAPAVPALAGSDDYQFELVTLEAKVGAGTAVEVRLIDKRTGKAVPDAVIMAKRMDMAPDGMASMDSAIETAPATTPGHYRFMTNLTMAGRWQLSLGAKVQGEASTVVGRLVVKAVK